MRIVVLGASGTMGKLITKRLADQEHDVVAAMRANGVDSSTGVGLDEAFAGADAVIDCTNYMTMSARKAIEVLGRMSTNVVAAAKRADVPHLVLLSIVNAAAPELRGMGYYQGKAAQERIVAAGSVPYTIVHTTQWYELVRSLMSQVRVGKVAFVPHMLSAPMAAESAAEVLCEVSAGPAQRLREVAGPDLYDLSDLAQAVANQDRSGVRVVPIPYPGASRALSGGALLPGPDVERRGPTFEAWLTTSYPPTAP